MLHRLRAREPRSRDEIQLQHGEQRGPAQQGRKRPGARARCEQAQVHEKELASVCSLVHQDVCVEPIVPARAFAQNSRLDQVHEQDAAHAHAEGKGQREEQVVGRIDHNVGQLNTLRRVHHSTRAVHVRRGPLPLLKLHQVNRRLPRLARARPHPRSPHQHRLRKQREQQPVLTPQTAPLALLAALARNALLHALRRPLRTHGHAAQEGAQEAQRPQPGEHEQEVAVVEFNFHVGTRAGLYACENITKELSYTLMLSPEEEAAMRYWKSKSPYAREWSYVRCAYSFTLKRWVYVGWNEPQQKVSYIYEKSRNHWTLLAQRPTDLTFYQYDSRESYNDNEDDAYEYNSIPLEDNGVDRPQVREVDGEDKADDVEVMEHILSNLIEVLINKGYLVDGEVQQHSYAHVAKSTDDYGRPSHVVSPFPYMVKQ